VSFARANSASDAPQGDAMFVSNGLRARVISVFRTGLDHGVVRTTAGRS
jgi:hypothetical protein